MMLVRAPGEIPRTVEELIGPGLLRALERVDMRSRRVFAGRLPGERRSKRRGSSVEFDDHRPYVPGDDLRRLDWNVFARTDRRVLKLFREDEDMAVRLIVDASASMLAGTPTKLETACRIAMAVGAVGLMGQNRVSASVIGLGGGPGGLAAVRGRPGVRRLGEFLLGVLERASEAGAEGGLGTRAGGGFNPEVRRIAGDRLAGAGVAVVVSDFLLREGWTGGLDALAAARGFDTWLVQVLAPEEIEPARALGGDGTGFSGDMRLEDAEGGPGSEVTVSRALLRRYVERLAALEGALEADARARGMRRVRVASDADVGELTLGVLRRRGLVG